MPERPPRDVSPAHTPHSALGLGRVARKSGWAVAGDGKGDLELAADWYRQLVDHSPDGICVYRDGLVLYVNPAGTRLMLAESADELIGRPITDFVTSESLPPMLDDIAELRHLGEFSRSLPARMIRCDGTLLDVEVVAVLTVWDREVAYEVITRDVSERNAKEAALRYQAALVNHVSDAIIGTTTNGIVTSWNPAAETIYGRPADEAVGCPVSDLV